MGPINDRRRRFAVVGCGRIASSHFAAIDENVEQSEIVGVCDIASDALEVLRGEAAADTGGEEGLCSLELLIAAYLSTRDVRRINLPLEY